jgi:hypothetical protein
VNNFVASNPQEYSPWWHKNKHKYSFLLHHIKYKIQKNNIKDPIARKIIKHRRALGN